MTTKKKYISVIPIILMIGLIPLIVRLKKVSYPYLNFIWSANNKIGYDIFAYYKSVVITLIGSLLLIRVLYLYLNHRINFKNKYLILLLSSALLILLSYVFSKHQYIASVGFKDRYEGTYVLLSYIVISLYILVEYKSIYEIDITFKYSIVFIVLISLIGIGQYFKIDIFQYDWGKLLLAPKEKIGDLVFKSQLGRVYMTLYNPNYVGTYFVLIGPLIANMFINSKKRWKESIYLLIYLALVFSLAGSQSRGGFLGALVGLAILCILNFFYNRKVSFFEKKIKLFIVIILFMVVFFNHGNNSSRINSILEDTKEKIPIKEILTIDDKLYINYNHSGFFIQEENNSFVLYQGELINYNKKQVNMKEKLEVMPDWIAIKEVFMSDGAHTFIVTVEDIKLPFANTATGMKYINRKAYYADLKRVPSINVYGRESMGSGRVYIWSRSIPLLRDSIILGNGADTYALIFPQTDYIGKFKGFGDYKRLSETIVDKPHNLYLQIAINTGVISLIIYLTINFMLIFDLLYLIKKGNYLDKAIPLVSIIIGYGITMIFNDSTVVVSSIYWSIIGLSMVLVKLGKTNNSINFFHHRV